MVTAAATPKALKLPDELHLLDGLLCELHDEFDGIENDQTWKIKNTRYLKSDQDEADIVELQRQLDVCGKKIAAVTSKMASVRKKEAMSASVELAMLEKAREEEAGNVADLGRSLIAKRNDLTASRGELLTKLEGLVEEWFSKPLAGYLDAHTAFVEAVESLEEVGYTEGGARKFSPAIKLMLERLRGEAGLRPEPPERQPNDMQRLRDGVRQLIHGHPCEQRSEVELDSGLVGFLR